MKRVFLYRQGAYGDHIHLTNVIKAFDQEGWDITFSYNFKGRQVHQSNPRIDHYEHFEFSSHLNSKEGGEAIKVHHERLKKAKKEYDKFVSFQDSLEGSLIAVESSPEYFWPLSLRRQKNSTTCYYDQSMIWAGFTDKKYMGWGGEIFSKTEDHEFIKDSLKVFKDKYIILWAMRGSMWQKAVCHIANAICDEWLSKHPDTVIITTGDKFCQQWEWESAIGKTIRPDKGLGDGTATLVHRSGRMPFRQAMLMSNYVDMVVTPETGLGISAGAYGTPKIMMLTAASPKNIVGNDKNDYSIQSDAWCSPCSRAIYNTRNCPIGPGEYINGKNIDWDHPDFKKIEVQALPICVEFPKEIILKKMEDIYENHGLYNMQKRNAPPDKRSAYM